MSVGTALTLGLIAGLCFGYFLRLMMNNLNNRTYKIRGELKEAFKDIFIRQLAEVDVHFTIGGKAKEEEKTGGVKKNHGANEYDLVLHAQIIDGAYHYDERIPGKVSVGKIEYKDLSRFRETITSLYRQDYRDKSLLMLFGLQTGLVELKCFRFTLHDSLRQVTNLYEYYPEYREGEGYVGFFNSDFPTKENPVKGQNLSQFNPLEFYQGKNVPRNRAYYDLTELRESKTSINGRPRYLVYLLSKSDDFIRDGKKVHEPRLKNLGEVPKERQT